MKPKSTVKAAPIKKGLLKSLPKLWHKFLVLKDFAIINGRYSQAHKRYKGRNLQSSSICIVACAMAKLNKFENWSQDTLDQILELGTNLYLKTLQVTNNKCLGILKPTQVYKYFFIGDLKITMSVGIDTVTDKITKESNYRAYLEEKLNKFLTMKEFGILSLQNRFFAISKYADSFFLFDPVEHELDGSKWRGIPGLGYCYVMKFSNLAKLVDRILDNVALKQVTNFTLYPCLVEKVVKVDVSPPESIEGRPQVNKDNKISEGEVKVAKIKAPKKKEEEKVDGVPISRIPPEKPRIKSETKFQGIPGLGDGKCGILRGSTHQRDPKFTRYLGAQELSNAVAALTMLRLYKSKHWNRKVVDGVLKLGEWIHHYSKNLRPPGEITDKIQLGDRFYTAKIKKLGTVGVLGSTKPGIWDLKPALANFFAENDCCIVLGPYTVASWIENGVYYMFDPNERDSAGRINNDKSEPGVACVTWYDNLKSLVETYMSNVPINAKNDRFHLWQVKILDYVELPDDWYNFKAMSFVKWILRGNFSQNANIFTRESRGVQCTANATMALVFAKLTPPQEWSAETIDDILLNGDNLYNKSVAILKANDLYRDPLLMVDEVQRTFPLGDKQIDLKIIDCKINGCIKGDVGGEFPNLMRGIRRFFEESESGVLTAGNQSISIWKWDDAYYYFDSHTRDENGLASAYGTACLLRHVDIDDLSQSVLTNIGTCVLNAYNLSVVNVHLIEQTDEGIIKPPLNNFTELTDCVAILRSSFSQSDDKFGLSRDRQTVPNCLVAMALNQLNSAEIWNKQELDQVLEIGDKLFIKSVIENAKQPQQEDLGDETEDAITTLNVYREVKIGKNKFEIEFEDFAQGNFEENFKEALEVLLPPVEEVADEHGDEEEHEGDVVKLPPPEPEANNFALILESPLLTVSIWKDDHMIYLFDPKSRDERGQIYGKDDWSVKIDENEEEEGDDNNDEHSEEEDDDNDNEERDDKAGGDFDAGSESIEEEKEEGEETASNVIKEKHDSAYWRAKAQESGKACLIRFCRLSHLINHIIDNTPPTRRDQLEFTLKTVKLNNKPIAHDLYDPEDGDKADEIAGDWYNFKEVDYGKWCLRGVKTKADVIFPDCNKNQQDIPACLNALAFVQIYALSKFKTSSVDSIMVYGDRLLSFVRRLRLKELKSNKDLGLSDEECEEIVKTLKFTLKDYPRKFCINEKLITTDIKEEVIIGDANSTIPDILDIKDGVNKFFENYTMGLLTCKNVLVAIWKLDGAYYMYDPNSRGPNGVESTLGVPCITRFLNPDSLAFIYKKNLPKFGEGVFVIDSVTIEEGVCPRERQPEEQIVKPIKLGGFQVVVPGRAILRGDLKPDFSMFDRGVHIQSPAIAFVALTMSLVQKPETWTKLVVNEILQIGDELYNDSIEALGMKFNPWAQKLDIYRISSDFKVGILKANTALRYMEQRGVVDIKNNPKIPNLRQGLERFFEENTHGIILTDNLVLAVWEEERDDAETCIYLFDPNPRGATGLPTTGGVACVMKFCNAIVLAEHLMSSLMGVDKENLEYVIVPVEIVVGEVKTRRKVKKSPCEQKKKDVDSSNNKKLCQLVTNSKKQCKDNKNKDSNIPVTCPSKCVAVEEKRTLRHIAEEERRKQEAKRQALLGRNDWYKINDSLSLTRALRYAKQYHDLPTCVVAFVLLKITNLDKFSAKNLEIIVQCGEQLYMDCYNAYNPPQPALGLQHILRTFFLKGGMQATVGIFKPIMCTRLESELVLKYLEKYFVKNNFALFYYIGQWVALYLKQGYYYYFDPYPNTLEGVREQSGKGWASLSKCGDLRTLVELLCNNLRIEDEQFDVENEQFALVLVTLKKIEEVKPNN